MRSCLILPNVAGMTSPELDPEAVRVGATIRALRRAHGLKIVELARATDVTGDHISNVEAGRKMPSMGLCRRIAETLGLPLAAITVRNYEQVKDSA